MPYIHFTEEKKHRASGDNNSMGVNAFFCDAAEGLLTSVILLLAEFLPPEGD